MQGGNMQILLSALGLLLGGATLEWPGALLGAATVGRTVHQRGPVPFTQSALYASLQLQAALALTWSQTALTAMVLATRRGLLLAWMAWRLYQQLERRQTP